MSKEENKEELKEEEVKKEETEINEGKKIHQLNSCI